MSRRYYAPEVVQTSGMDCGPAVLASLLQGFGIEASYARLRDACHTNVDGTSIDDLESVAAALGLEVSQVMIPVDHVLLPDANLLPAIVVTKLPGGFAHFVLAWRRHGSRIQIMDPAVGRRWVSESEFLRSLYVHEHTLSPSTWQQWATSDGNLALLRTRLRELTSGRDAALLIQDTTRTNDWRAIAKLDAATRMAKSLCRSGIRRGSEIRSILKSLVVENEQAPRIPKAFWSVRSSNATENDDGEPGELVVTRGAVMIRCGGRVKPTMNHGDLIDDARNGRFDNLIEPPRKPFRELWQLVPHIRLGSAMLIVLAISLAAVAVLGETLLYRSVLDAGRDLVLPEQRMFGVGILLLFSASILVLDKSIAEWLLGIGRSLECQLRLQLQRKIPKLAEEYLNTRPTSDTAERVHAIAEIRSLPSLCSSVARAVVTLVLTASAISWIDPASAPIAFAAAFLALVVPMIVLSKLRELDLSVRTHGGALSLYYYDALMGLTAIRAHHADRAIRREHDALLLQWVRSSRRLVIAAVAAESVQSITGFGLAAWLLFLHAGQFAAAGSTLLVAYWALSLPALGEQIISLAKQIPMHRSVALRLLEPLNAPEDTNDEHDNLPQTNPVETDSALGVHLKFSDVSVIASGRAILSNVSVDIPAGCHVGIVGVSGAGKSTLLSLLLGWNRVAKGTVQVDSQPLTSSKLRCLRSVTTWVDPTTQLWNRSLARNVMYGAEMKSATDIGEIMDPTDLTSVLERLPNGFQTKLGESGCLLSGGEGQRVRFARAAFHKQSRLAILDEPFRGLDRGTRRRLMNEARKFWQDATLLCVTHDVSETSQFDRVMVIEDGEMIEFGEPQTLMQQADSRYRELLIAERHADIQLWQGQSWSHYSLQGGRLRSKESEASIVSASLSEGPKRNGCHALRTKNLATGGVN